MSAAFVQMTAAGSLARPRFTYMSDTHEDDDEKHKDTVVIEYIFKFSCIINTTELSPRSVTAHDIDLLTVCLRVEVRPMKFVPLDQLFLLVAQSILGLLLFINICGRRSLSPTKPAQNLKVPNMVVVVVNQIRTHECKLCKPSRKLGSRTDI